MPLADSSQVAPLPSLLVSEPTPTKSPWWPPLAAAIAHAALMLLAGPPVNFWPLALIASTPLGWYLRRGTNRPGRDAILLILGVSPMWLVWEWWMYEVTAPGFPFFILLQCSWTALFFWGARRLHQMAPKMPWFCIVPMVWVAVEFFRGEIFLSGYSAALVPYPLINLPELASPAAWLGVYFVSFMVVLFGNTLYEIIVGRGKARIAAAGVLAVLALIWGLAAVQLHRQPVSSQTVTAGIVQTNLPQSNKLDWSIEDEIGDWKRFAGLTETLVQSSPKPDFILWPETMMPGDTLERNSINALANAGVGHRLPNGKLLPPDVFYLALLDLQQQVGVPMVVGEDAIVNLRVEVVDGRVKTSRDARHNSAYLVASGAVQPARYDKVRLTPFGETMPFISRWPWLQQQMLAFGAHGMKFDLEPGLTPAVLPVPLASGGTVRLVTPICFESTVGGFCREMVFEKGERRADLIANLTNDGWFGNSDIAREQHLGISRWRCIELATPMARCANTGISALIDARGRILSQGVEGSQQKTKIDGILKGPLPLGTGVTLYARVGNVFPRAVLALTSAALTFSFVRRWLPGRSTGAGPQSKPQSKATP